MSRLILAFYIIATTLGLIALKLGTNGGLPVSIADDKLQFNINAYVISGILFYGISFMLYMSLISKYDLGYIIPMTAAFVYVAVFVSSYFIFKEAFTVTKIIGISLIVGGLFFLNLTK